MVYYASLHSIDLLKMFLCSKCEDSIPFGYLETKLKITNDSVFMFYGPWNTGHDPTCVTTFSWSSPDVPVLQVWELFPFWLLRNWAICNRWKFAHAHKLTCACGCIQRVSHLFPLLKQRFITNGRIVSPSPWKCTQLP